MMQSKVEVTISVIIHATENANIVINAIGDLGVKHDVFESTKTTGHFNNIITIYNARITGNDARHFVQKFTEMLSDDDLDMLIKQSPERTVDSRLHIRIEKQTMIRDRRIEIINLYESDNKDDDHNQRNITRDMIKIKIYTPIYNKRDTVQVFEKILRGNSNSNSKP